MQNDTLSKSKILLTFYNYEVLTQLWGRANIVSGGLPLATVLSLSQGWSGPLDSCELVWHEKTGGGEEN